MSQEVRKDKSQNQMLKTAKEFGILNLEIETAILKDGGNSGGRWSDRNLVMLSPRLQVNTSLQINQTGYHSHGLVP